MPDCKHKKVWREMIHRCHNKDRNDYKYYGAKGITVCDLWRESYEEFNKWSLNNGYKEGLTIERVNGDIGYEPDNCAWVDRETQCINRHKFSNNTSGYTGVAFNSKNLNWVSYINNNKVRVHLGSFKSAKEAVVARNTYITTNKLKHKLQEV